MKNKFFKFLSLVFVAVVGTIPLLTGCGFQQNGGNDQTPARVTATTVSTSFGGRSAYIYKGINDKDVTVETFFINQNEAENNPNIGQAVMLNGAIRYKQAHPDEEVYASITSFHFSVVASVCLDSSSPNYLKMKSLYDKDYDDEGYVRIAYLPIKAAMIGINVIVIGQIDASAVMDSYSTWAGDVSFEEYFTGHLNDETNISGKKVSDYLTFRVAKWTSYGDKSATDMMHLKSSSVSNYRDVDGVDHGCALWLGSTNVDGIDYRGYNGNNNTQSAVIVTDHNQMRNVLWNYTKLIAEYCGQEDIYEFRHLMNIKNKEQIDLINAGKASEIASDEQIVYLGTEKDSVFELYLTPLGDSVNEWDSTYNPYCKYIEKLLPSVSGNNGVTFSWATAKFVDDSAFSDAIVQILVEAFKNNKNVDNRLFLHLPYWSDDPTVDVSSKRFDYTIFDSLVVGQDIAFKKFGASQGVHAKDFQLSYVENNQRQYVTVLNSLNFHQGSAYYQTNSFLVIKENETVGNNVYVDFGKLQSEGAIVENDRLV